MLRKQASDEGLGQTSYFGREVLLQELAGWEAAIDSSCPSLFGVPGKSRRPCWLVLQQTIGHLGPPDSTRMPSTNQSSEALLIASTLSGVLRDCTDSKSWAGLQRGARFIRMWFSLFVHHVV